MKKRTISLLLTLVMLVGYLPGMHAAGAVEDIYVVAGVDSLCGSNWDGNDIANQMTRQGDAYVKTFPNVGVGTGYQLKVVRNGSEWIGDPSGSNVTFHVTAICDVTVTYHPLAQQIVVSGTGVSMVTELDIEAMRTVGNGDPDWLNGALWDPADDDNRMTEISPKVYRITYRNVPAFDGYMVKFAANGSWADNWGGIYQGSGVKSVAEYNAADNIIVDVPYELADVTLTLDLTQFNYSTKSGATFTVEVVEVTAAPHDHIWTYEFNGAAVRASCTVENCNYDADTTLILQAPTLTLEGGEGSPNATLSASTLAGSAVDAAAIEYAPRGGDTWSSDAPTAAGAYTTRFPVVDGYISADYIIHKNFSGIRAVGDGHGTWLNGVQWEPDADANLMTEVSPRVYQIDYEAVAAGDYEFKFVANGGWDEAWWGEFLNFGVKTQAMFSYGPNICIRVPYDNARVTLTLDLAAFDYASGSGATFTVEIEDPASVVHTHSWLYTVNGSTLTITCGGKGECDYAGTDTTLTLQASTLMLEGGDGSPNATLSGDTVLGVPVDASMIQYRVNGYYQWEAPTTAGKYQALYNFNGRVIRREYTIEAPILSVRAVGNGLGAWLNDSNWDPAEDKNLMTQISDKLYRISYVELPAGDNYQVKFAANGSWDTNWGGVCAGSGVESDAVYFADNIIFQVPFDNARVILTLDLTNYDLITHEGATFTVEVTEPAHEHRWSYTVQGDTVTVACIGDGICDFTGTDTELTLQAPTQTQEGGTGDPNATLSAPTLAGMALDIADIEYAPTGSDSWSHTVPLAAGVYTARFPVGDQYISVDYTLARFYGVWVEGEMVTDQNCSLPASTWSYDPDTGTLTLKAENYLSGGEWGYAVYSTNEQLTVRLEGASDYCIQGIGVPKGSLNIEGVASPSLSLDVARDGFCVNAGTTTVIGVGDVTVTGGNTLATPYQGQLNVNAAGDITITAFVDSALVNAPTTLVTPGNVKLNSQGSGMIAAESLTIQANHVAMVCRSSNPGIAKSITVDAAGDVIIQNLGSGMVLSAGGTIWGGNVEISGSAYGPTVSGNLTVDAAGRVAISNSETVDGSLLIAGRLTVVNATEVWLQAKASSPLISSGAEIHCSGDVTIRNLGKGIVLAATSAIHGRNVTVKGDYSSSMLAGDLSITAIEDVTMENAGSGLLLSGSATIQGRNITLTGHCVGAPMISGNLTLDAAGSVKLTSDASQACSSLVYQQLKILNAASVEIQGNCNAHMLYEGFEIHCSGDVTVVNHGTGGIASGSQDNLLVCGNAEIIGNTVGMSMIGNGLQVTAQGAVRLIQQGQSPCSGVVNGGKLTVHQASTLLVSGNCFSPLLYTVSIRCAGVVELNNRGVGGVVYDSDNLEGSTLSEIYAQDIVITGEGGAMPLIYCNLVAEAEMDITIAAYAPSKMPILDGNIALKGRTVSVVGATVTGDDGAIQPLFHDGLTLHVTDYALLHNQGEGAVLPGGLSFTAGSKDPIIYPSDLFVSSVTTSGGNMQLLVDGTVWNGSDPAACSMMEILPRTAVNITFRYQDGVTGDTAAQTNAEYKLTTLPEPTRTGFVFAGWYTAQEGGEPVDTNTVFADDTIVYARWSACGHTGSTAQPGCTQDALCSICGGTIPALEHDLIPHEAKAPTCTEAGWEAYVTCKRCEYTTRKDLTALDHDIIHMPLKNATQNEDGHKEHWRCQRCGKCYADAEGRQEISPEAVVIKYSSQPITGDSTNRLLLWAMVIIGILGICGVLIIGRKRRVW